MHPFSTPLGSLMFLGGTGDKWVKKGRKILRGQLSLFSPFV